jgi:phage regulator Rha-like protein
MEHLSEYTYSSVEILMPEFWKMKEVSIPDEVVLGKIYEIRNHKVMLDRDLAELFGVPTKVLKQSVRRNIRRFPTDFMFEMTKEELLNWRSQFVTSNSVQMGLRYPPFCFTEQGITMLSCVLNSDRAVQMNIQIVRIFTHLRERLMSNQNALLLIEELKLKFVELGLEVQSHDERLKVIIRYLKKLMDKPKVRRSKIGFLREEP